MIELFKFRDIDYAISFPNGFVKGERYPVILHFHGAGSRGRDISLAIDNQLFNAQISGNKDLAYCIIVAPQCYADSWFDIFGEVVDFCNYIYERNFVDKDRFYGSGISMGGYCLHQLLMTCRKLFAGAIVCCGAGMYWNAGRISHIPLYVFHGLRDEVVYPDEALHMRDKLRSVGADVTLTLYPDCDHDCWTKAYAEPWLFCELLSKKRVPIFD